MKKTKTSSVNPNDLFSPEEDKRMFASAPLSYRMRPRTIEEYVGQKHILGPGKLLTRAIESDRVSSLVLYGPPGSGKTTLATCISQKTQSPFVQINAVSSNVEELRKILAASQNRRRMTGEKTILFIDEIHRFNKSQQDVLMPDIEAGHVILIGATVFNPYFSLVSPLLSRSLVFELQPLTKEDLVEILQRALKDKEKGLGEVAVEISSDVLAFIADMSDGDARKALNALEIGCRTTAKDSNGVVHFTMDVAQESIQQKQVVYDREDDAHYDTASAFIKSIRGSDPDATLYWLAKMLYAGEDPRFIARRICISAAEDVGNADPQALVLANAAFQISEFIGLPEARIPLAQAAVYVACAPKSNAAYLGLENATADIKNSRAQEVPQHLKDASYPGAKELARGEGYKYAHDYPDHYVKQQYMPRQATYYFPTENGYEKKILERLTRLRAQVNPPGTVKQKEGEPLT